MPPPETPTRTRRLLPTLLAALVAGGLVWQSTAALFYDTSTTSPDLTTATVVLDEEDVPAVIFDIADMVPDESKVYCFNLKYQGNAPASKLNPVTVELANATITPDDSSDGVPAALAESLLAEGGWDTEPDGDVDETDMTALRDLALLDIQVEHDLDFDASVQDCVTQFVSDGDLVAQTDFANVAATPTGWTPSSTGEEIGIRVRALLDATASNEWQDVAASTDVIFRLESQPAEQE